MKLIKVAKPKGKLSRNPKDRDLITANFKAVGYYDNEGNYYEKVTTKLGEINWFKLESEAN